MNPRAVQYERPDADQVQITARSDEASPNDTEQVISVSEFMNQQHNRESKQCSTECQTHPIPLPSIQLNYDYSPDENEQKFVPQMNSFCFTNTHPLPLHQQPINEFTNLPNPLVGFSDECRDRINILLEAERYLMTYEEDYNYSVYNTDNSNRRIPFSEIFNDPRVLCSRTRISPTVSLTLY
jgi:hypothetical protein